MRIKSLVAAIFVVLLLYVVVFAQSPMSATVLKNANLRAGPGTTYAVAGTVKAGQTVTIVGKNDAGDWYHLNDNHWLAAFLVKVIGTVTPTSTIAPTVAASTPTASPTSTVSPTLTSVPQPTSTAVATHEPTKVSHSDPVTLAYIQDLGDALTLLIDGLKIVNEQTTAASTNPYLLVSLTWKAKLLVGLNDLKLCATNVRKLVPPDDLTDAHQDFLKMAERLDVTVRFIAYGVQHVDGKSISAGAIELRLALASMNAAKAKMDAVISQ